MELKVTTGIVFQEDGQAMTTSIIVAREFGKEHRHVLDAIRKLIAGYAENPAYLQKMFRETSYVNEQNGVSYPMYHMTQDGFTLLAMGFTGERALEFKMKFLQAFNAMREMLSSDEYILARSSQIYKRLNEQLSQKVQMLEGENSLLEQENKLLAPKAEVYDHVINSDETYTFEQIGKQLNFRSTQAFTKRLMQDKICYKRSDTYMLYADYASLGLTAPRTRDFIRKDGTIGSRTYTVWTEKGRIWLHKRYNVSLQPIDLTMFTFEK